MTFINTTGTYLVQGTALFGKRANVTFLPGADTCLAQFDDMSLGVVHTHTWTSFPLTHFKLDPPAHSSAEFEPVNPEPHDEVQPELLNKKMRDW